MQCRMKQTVLCAANKGVKVLCHHGNIVGGVTVPRHMLLASQRIPSKPVRLQAIMTKHCIHHRATHEYADAASASCKA